jgi:N-acetylated-alpha-linked acidic dipeptidase
VKNLVRFCALASALTLSLGAAAPSTEQRLESAFLAIPSADGARATSQVMNQSYHYPGTPGDHQLALYMRDRMRAFGLNARIESFPATVYTPRSLSLALLTTPVVSFDLHDRAAPGDAGGSRPGIGLPFNAGSGSGEVTARVVDLGAGIDRDYTRVGSNGIDVRGKIALIRYGAEYRGSLAKRAQDHGAAGVIFFTDPSTNKGPAYPNGPYPSDFTIQRGEVMDSDKVPLKIPTLPIDARNARVIIANMHHGLSDATVRLHVEMNARQTTLWNSIGEIPGTHANQSIILGGHRDAWVFGVSDDGSGIATLLEVARGLGQLHRSGWTPDRTIVIAGWDAEEIGELGSAAYVAMHRSQLQRGCIAYINTDESASGPDFGAAAAGAIADDATTVIRQTLGISKPDIGDPAGGSDFESFIYGVGTPILDLGYTGPLGTYHSPYDDFRYASLYADPGFVHHKTIAQAIGIFAMRLAQSSRPLHFVPYVAALNSGLRDLVKTAKQQRLAVDSVSLTKAIHVLQARAIRYDAVTMPQDVPVALRVAQQLDRIAYSASGYSGVAFPTIVNALATGKQSAVDAEVRATVVKLNQAASLLH